MSVQLQQIKEIDCKIAQLDTERVLQRIAHHSIDEVDYLETDVAYILDECLNALKPRGVYKLFNPAICTLPPNYTEPAIKLVGTMMVFKGKEFYNRMKKAQHTALFASTIGSQEEQDALRQRLCYTPLQEDILTACFKEIGERAADMVNAIIIQQALDEGLYTDDRLMPGESDFPLETRSDIVFYVQAEKRLGQSLDKAHALKPDHSIVGVVGLYDKSRKGRRRACGRCKYREFCSIRSIGMNCHGNKGSFK